MEGESRPLSVDVTVVIPTLGRPTLEGCLESILQGTVWPFEVIVVDQGTSFETSALLDEVRSHGLSVHHVPSERRGIAAATNRGLQRVRTTFAALTHDDCRVGGQWLEALSARLRTLGDAVLTGRVEPLGEGVVLTVVRSRTPITYTKPLIDRDVLFPPNMALPVRLLDRVGYFDEHPSLSLAAEDNEWAYRASRAGVPIVYDPEIVVSHLAMREQRDLASLYRLYARGQGSFYGKYVRRGDLFIVLRALRDLMRGPWLLLRGIVSRNPKLIAMGRGETMGILPGIISGMRRTPELDSDRSRKPMP